MSQVKVLRLRSFVFSQSIKIKCKHELSHGDKKQGCFQQYFTVLGTAMSKFMYIQFLFKKVSWFWDACKQWDLRGLGLLMGSVAMLSLCLVNTFIWKDHCCIGIIPFCIINNFIVMKKNSLEISMQSLTSHNQLIHCHKIVIVIVKSVSDWGYFFVINFLLFPLLGKHWTCSTSDSWPRKTEINTTTTSTVASCT